MYYYTFHFARVLVLSFFPFLSFQEPERVQCTCFVSFSPSWYNTCFRVHYLLGDLFSFRRPVSFCRLSSMHVFFVGVHVLSSPVVAEKCGVTYLSYFHIVFSIVIHTYITCCLAISFFFFLLLLLLCFVHIYFLLYMWQIIMYIVISVLVTPSGY